MDGLLFVLMILWLCFGLGKKKKKQGDAGAPKGKRSAKPVLADAQPQRSNQRLQQLHAAIEKKKAELRKEAQPLPAEPPELGEGESFFNNIAYDRAATQEGECTCDPTLAHEREERPEPESVYSGEIGREPLVDVSARGILQGVVMAEILNRPVRRAHRR